MHNRPPLRHLFRETKYGLRDLIHSHSECATTTVSGVRGNFIAGHLAGHLCLYTPCHHHPRSRHPHSQMHTYLIL